MSNCHHITVDGNEAVASVAHRLSESIVLYPITPASPIGELCDEWASKGKTNLWGELPQITEMQSEGGAIGAVHGALQAGVLATTFTASQGLLLMIPNLYKIAGELTSLCMHVASRSVATHALSIFGDHSDVMACRQIGLTLLASGSVQEAHDLACIGHCATLASRVPVLHFFDGFRTSHEIACIEPLTDEELRAMVDLDLIDAHRQRALRPEKPLVRGTAQNPDVFFQAREACNRYYERTPGIVQQTMDRFAQLTGRGYHLFDYHGDPNAERVIVIMGSGADTVHETVDALDGGGERVGVIKVRLFRPFSADHLVAALPSSTRSIAVLDRTKEPGAAGEPLYQDVVTAVHEAASVGRLSCGNPRVIGGRYGLSSKEFTPAMVRGIYDELAKDEPKNHFTIGIVDDVTHTSLSYDERFDIEPSDVTRAVFYGLGSDGTVGANKNSIKIISDETDQYAQGYFVYDSKKSGSMTTSHLRFGPRPIRAPYLIREADFVACHQFIFLEHHDVLEHARAGGVFLLNSPYGPEQVWDELPEEVQQQIIEKHLHFYVIDGYKVARETGMGRRVNTIMQTCFFAISGILPREEAIAKIKAAIEKTYGKKGRDVVERNWRAVDQTLDHLYPVQVPAEVSATFSRPPIVPDAAPDFVKRVTAVMLEGKGDALPVSAFPPDGTWPTATSQWEKRGIAENIPIWDSNLCIQCNKCAVVCPHAAIRAKVVEPEALDGAPQRFKAMDYKAPDFRGLKYVLQVAPDDCTGCNLCVNVCPAKDRKQPDHKAINMSPRLDHREVERENFDYFLKLPQIDRAKIKRLDAKGSQFMLPLIEYSGACSGCGETPYLKMLTQLFGDRMLIANATGCSSIYGGNLPTTPYCVNAEGQGPAWSNSLFEDNAEFGLGMRLGVEHLREEARSLVRELASQIGEELAAVLLAQQAPGDAAVAARREAIAALRKRLAGVDSPEGRRLDRLADYLLDKSVWLVGGDGWAYDIGFGGLDHVLSLDHNVNILVMDTQAYSNTGGQQSKATPLGAVAKFAAGGKSAGKKDLGLMAMSYRHVYVASVAIGANDNHTVKALLEAEAYPGPSLVIAYGHCIAHGFDLSIGLDQQKLAVESGAWPLYRFDPRRIELGQPPLQLDFKRAKASETDEYHRHEGRFRMVEKVDPARFSQLAGQARRDAEQRLAIYEQLANLVIDPPTEQPSDEPEAVGAEQGGQGKR